jgi:hypothetical protein
MDIYVVEFWSNRMYRHTEPRLEECFETNVCHYASSLDAAKAWCKNNLDYGGCNGMEDYFPWHFRIFRHTLDIDEGTCIPSGYGYWKFMYAMNPSGRQRKVTGYGR